MRQNLELSNQSSGQQLQSDASARKELQATLEAVAAREAAAKRALDDAARDKAAQDLRIRDLEANLQQLASATAPKRRGRASSSSSNASSRVWNGPSFGSGCTSRRYAMSASGARIALRTTLRDRCRSRAIALMAFPDACSRRILNTVSNTNIPISPPDTPPSVQPRPPG